MPLKVVVSKQKCRHGENIHCEREISPTHLNYDISLPITFLKIDTWNKMISVSLLYLKKRNVSKLALSIA